MVRIVKEYDERFAEFLDVAQDLFYSKGYEQTSVQAIIKAVGVAKGTFYHYFDSKVDLLDALIERMIRHVLEGLQPLIADETMGVIEKLKRFFDEIDSWKIANRDLMIATVRILYMDENVLLRTKMREETTKKITPLLAKIIQQGIEQYIFDVRHPDETAQLILKMSEGLSQSAVTVLLAEHYDQADIEQVKRQIDVYNDSIGRVLGVPQRTLILINPTVLNNWFPESEMMVSENSFK